MKEVLIGLVMLALPVIGLGQTKVYKGMVNTTISGIYKDPSFHEDRKVAHPPLQKGDSVVLINYDLWSWHISLGKNTGYVRENELTVEETTKEKFIYWGPDAQKMFLNPEQKRAAAREEARKDSIRASYQYLVGLTKEQVLARLGKPWEDRVWGDLTEGSSDWQVDRWEYERVTLFFTKGIVAEFHIITP